MRINQTVEPAFDRFPDLDPAKNRLTGSMLTSLSSSLTSRRGATGWLLGFLAVIAVLFSVLSSADAATRAPDSGVPGSESARVQQLLDGFESSGRSTAVLVATRPDAATLTDADRTALDQLQGRLDLAGVQLGKPLLSDDAQAGMLTASWDERGSLADRQVVAELREQLAAAPAAALQVQVTGGPAFALDVAHSFDGANFTLLAVTVAIVAVLLILTYRSPILWLLPLAVVGLADRAASLVTAALAGVWDLHFDTGVLSVLVFGAGTNYALLLISRYRDELRVHAGHRTALAAAWRSSFEAIATSNLTVVLALASLVLAVMEDTRGLGIACAVGLLIAALFVLGLLPPVLALAGRKVFWPLVPAPHQPAPRRSRWAQIATAVTARPVLSLVSVGAVLAVLAAVLTGTGLGLKPAEQFRSPMESASASTVLTEHFPAGETQPATILTHPDQAPQVARAAEQVPGVQRVSELGRSADGSWQQLLLVGQADPGSSEDQQMLREVRTAIHAVDGADALLGGAGAEQLDAHNGHLRDFAVIAPLVLGICFVMLLVLTRSWLTAALLALVNLLSAAAALGLGGLIGSLVLGTSAFDVQVPLLAFLFLVALGVDYTIFLTQRIKQEAARQPIREAVIDAVGHTGAVITSAGVVLAGVFAALATLPLMVLGQLGLVVGLGVLLDTFLVRTVLVPALFTLLGRRNIPAWAPTRQPETAAASRTEMAQTPRS